MVNSDTPVVFTWRGPSPRHETEGVTSEEMIRKIHRMGELVQVVNQKRMDLWITIHQRLAEELGVHLTEELLIDRWEVHSVPSSEDCVLCKYALEHLDDMLPMSDHIVGMLGFNTVAAIELIAGHNVIRVYHPINGWPDGPFSGMTKYTKSFPIRPDSDIDVLAEQVACYFAEVVLRYHRERIGA